MRKYETRLLHTKTQRRINRMQDAAHFGIEYLKNKKFKLSEWWLQLIRQKCEEFLTELGYELNAIPSNYIDERPKSLEKVEKNLVILHQILNRNQDTTNLTQKLIEPLKNTIYPRIDNYIEQVKKVLKEENTSFGKSSSQEQIEQEPESLSDHIKNNVIPTIVDLEVKNQILDLLKDIKYLEDMKKFEFDYYQTQSSILLSSGTSPKDSSFHFKRINDVVPVTGLIIGRFHRLENEARTCLQVWKNK